VLRIVLKGDEIKRSICIGVVGSITSLNMVAGLLLPLPQLDMPESSLAPSGIEGGSSTGVIPTHPLLLCCPLLPVAPMLVIDSRRGPEVP
jgi:hypothetical protein